MERKMSYGDYPDLSRVKKILVIKLRHLGDVLLTAPVFSSLKSALPETQIDAYIYEEAKPMLEGHPAVSNLIGYDRKWKKLSTWQRMKKEWDLLCRIKKEKYDLVINLTEGDRGAIAALVARAQFRVGFQPKGKWQKKLYTHIVKHCPTLRHTVERNLDALRRIGIFPKIEERVLFFQIPESAKRKVEELAGSGPFVLIHPTSRWRFKCWPASKMRELTIELLKRGKRVVFTSGPDLAEIAMIEEITDGLDVVDLSGKVSLKELGALIEASTLLVCVDSVALHLASALKKKVVALFGPTSEITWAPWRNPHARIVAQEMSCRPCYQDGCGGSKMSDCLYTLKVSEVLNENLKLLSEVAPSCLGVGDELLRRS